MELIVLLEYQMIRKYMKKKLANFFCKEFISSLCDVRDQFYPYKHTNSHRQYINKLAWLCSSKTLLTKTGSHLDLACSSPTPGFTHPKK